jgi:hypothetical protein
VVRCASDSAATRRGLDLERLGEWWRSFRRQEVPECCIRQSSQGVTVPSTAAVS